MTRQIEGDRAERQESTRGRRQSAESATNGRWRVKERRPETRHTKKTQENVSMKNMS